MRISIDLISFICITILALSSSGTRDSIVVSLQPISLDSVSPRKLASITLDPSHPQAELTSYDNPDLSELFPDDAPAGPQYLRVGIYDFASKSWVSSTTLTSAKTLARGYSPTIVLNVNARGGVVSVNLKSYRVDAGQTRDFSPKVMLVKTVEGPRPYLNKPIVLIEGKMEQPVQEKSFLQKYWWVLLAGTMLMMSMGGDGE